jgi:hypothetical protein
MPALPAARDSLLTRWLEPAASALWILFFLWSAIVTAVWHFGLGEAEVQREIRPADLSSAVIWLLEAMDGFWILLAAANVHLAVASGEGLSAARRWAATCLGFVWVAATMASKTGYVHYTDRLGMHLGQVPLGLPLLWFAIVLGSRATALWLLPRFGYAIVAALTGILSLATDLNLEPIARNLRVWWLWHPGVIPEPAWPPAGNALLWLFVPAGLVLLFPEATVPKSPNASTRPWIIFAALNVVLLLGHFPRR